VVLKSMSLSVAAIKSTATYSSIPLHLASYSSIEEYVAILSDILFNTPILSDKLFCRHTLQYHYTQRQKSMSLSIVVLKSTTYSSIEEYVAKCSGNEEYVAILSNIPLHLATLFNTTILSDILFCR
jgi:hypothetical protein